MALCGAARRKGEVGMYTAPGFGTRGVKGDHFNISSSIESA